MGTCVEMKRTRTAAFAAILSLLALSACGTDPTARESKAALPTKDTLSAALSGIFSRKAPAVQDPVLVASTRAQLERLGNPAISVAVPKNGYFNFFGPYGQNGPVATWASSTLETVSLSDGILIATRGFGPDLMAARAPDIGQVRRATGYFHRGYSYLDGADQRQFIEYDCTFAPAGSESINVFAKTYVARKVVETCEGLDTSFENTYWFDNSGTLRQSDQRLSPQLPIMRLQRLVD